MTYRAQPQDGMVWITGAGSGIGQAVALELVRRGFRVAVTAPDQRDLDELVAWNENIHAFPGDVRDRKQMAAIVFEIEALYGPISLAFLQDEGRGFLPKIFAQTFEVNVGGTINSLAAVFDAMSKRKAGQIVIAPFLPDEEVVHGSPVFSSTKSALVAMAESVKLKAVAAGINIRLSVAACTPPR